MSIACGSMPSSCQAVTFRLRPTPVRSRIPGKRVAFGNVAERNCLPSAYTNCSEQGGLVTARQLLWSDKSLGRLHVAVGITDSTSRWKIMSFRPSLLRSSATPIASKRARA